MASEEEISRETRERLIESARQMRKTPTKAEALLWEYLRKNQVLGFKFRRQHIIRTYIVDFYCPACKLVIEVDGAIHKKQEDYDRERDADLRAMGYCVLRLKNQTVLTDIENTMAIIRQTLLSVVSTNPA